MAAIKKKVGPFKKFIKIKRTGEPAFDKAFGPTKRYSAKRKPQLVKAYGFIPTKRVK